MLEDISVRNVSSHFSAVKANYSRLYRIQIRFSLKCINGREFSINTGMEKIYRSLQAISVLNVQ